MVTMLRDGPHDAALVTSWMRDYGLFQGITARNRAAIVARFLRFAHAHKATAHNPNEEEIATLYAALFTALHREVPRSWMSATSKLLWCLYPDTIVIYDTFVHRTLIVMQSIDDDLSAFPRVGAPRSIDGEADIVAATTHYMNYQAMVRRLQTRHWQLLRDLRKRYNESYPYDVRIIDKLLWMIGNPRENYEAQA
ncbi:MAG: hypothetical protein HY067_22405 [Betaproteobacteria bacterium]|nr:hypothetical protein [Betaproteobacteria bacterium]